MKKDLHAFRGRIDLKYWPDNNDLVAAIGGFAQETEIYENDSWTEEFLSSPRYSMADYLRVILKGIEDRKRIGPVTDLLPKDFRFREKAFATLINCTLDFYLRIRFQVKMSSLPGRILEKEKCYKLPLIRKIITQI